MKFPQFRKYKNNQSYFLITDGENFTEWKRMTNKWEETRYTANILPDRVYIGDMLSHESEYWDTLSEEEFNAFLKSI